MDHLRQEGEERQDGGWNTPTPHTVGYILLSNLVNFVSKNGLSLFPATWPEKEAKGGWE